MKDTTVASRYAHALFIITEKFQETAQAYEDLKGVWEVVKPGTRVGHFLATPQVPLGDKRRALQETLTGRCLPSVVLFVDLLLRKKRLVELGTIVAAFEGLLEKSQGIRRATVASAVPLTDEERTRLLLELEHLVGAKIKLTSIVEPELLGGALVRIGDRVIDRTVKTLLERIGQQLFEASV